MPEILLHYIWSERLFEHYEQFTDDGKKIDVLSVGEHNTDAGPDFINARIRISGIELYGNVEIHISASDWNKHRHHTDHAYDNVILHVVCNSDTGVCNAAGRAVEQCSLKYDSDSDYLTGLIADTQQMETAAYRIECSQSLIYNHELLTQGWKKALLRQRLDCKAKAIRQLLDITHNDNESAFYITLARHFGFHTNGIPMEQTAIQTPLLCLLKHRNSLFQLTAVLLGQSGLLEDMQTDDRDALWKEYQFIKAKFNLVPIEKHLWKKLRMHPNNFPEIRLRQLAYLIYGQEFLFSKLTSCDTIEEMINVFCLKCEASEYDKCRVILPPPIGTDSIRTLIINTVLPYKYARGDKEQTYNLLERLPAENNRIIRQWKTVGQQVKTAADSQALLHLYTNYCQPVQCQNCDVGYQVFISQASVQATQDRA